MKFVFPDSVEKELAEQTKLQQKEHENTVKSEPTSETTPVELTPAQIKARDAQIQKITSKLYTPQSPFQPEYRSRSAEIEERLQRIQKRFEILKQKEAAKNLQLQKEAWLRYNHLAKPTLSDFKRPLTSFFLLASAIYMTMEYTWYVLERGDYVENQENKQTIMVRQLNDAFERQSQVLTEFETISKNKKWWKLW